MSVTSALPSQCVLSLGGEEVHLRAERALWWPSRRTLVVADLHLGKEEALLELGIPVPIGVIDETLERLHRLLKEINAARLLVLGDLVHHRSGLTAEVIDRVTEWRRTFAGLVELVPGNHEATVRQLPEAWEVTRLASEVREGPFICLHEPEARDEGYLLGGHLHPMVRIEGRVDRLLLPCFVIGVKRAILPAFTRFSRGVRVEAAVGDRVVAIADQALVEVPPSLAAS
ncbi:MAG: ligase-associated DNA damage response endonuclease PdeM [Phycisphaeraceae bacterium]|nr:ligase-associated DNA damage response endonuclease PdeM [Phycisphaeraceae bacterium]